MEKLTIVHSNELIEAAYSVSLDEMRLICLAATKVDSRKPNVGEIRIDVSEFIAVYGLSAKHAYEYLRSAVKSLMRKPIRMAQGDNVREIAWLEMNEYKRSGDGSHVLISFSRLVEPYLFDLKERFTSINFEHVAKLNTPFSFRLYQWLIQSKNLNKNKSGDAVSVELEVEWMKTQAGLNGAYKRWDRFKFDVLDPAVSKINANTDISIINPMPIRSGRKITAVRFIYALEKATQAKPLRPRLLRRPKVTKGSHEEGVWMRKNYKLLHDYREELKIYDPKAKLDLADLRKMAQYASIFDRYAEAELKREIAERCIKKEGSFL